MCSGSRQCHSQHMVSLAVASRSSFLYKNNVTPMDMVCAWNCGVMTMTSKRLVRCALRREQSFTRASARYCISFRNVAKPWEVYWHVPTQLCTIMRLTTSAKNHWCCWTENGLSPIAVFCLASIRFCTKHELWPQKMHVHKTQDCNAARFNVSFVYSFSSLLVSKRHYDTTSFIHMYHMFFCYTRRV